MSKPDLDAIRARHTKGRIQAWLPLEIVQALEDIPALLAYIGELENQIERVRALHRRVHAVFNWRSGLRYDEPCPDCDGKAGVHDCGCWADSDSEFVCAECHRLGGGSRDASYPCPTIQALGGDGE